MSITKIKLLRSGYFIIPAIILFQFFFGSTVLCQNEVLNFHQLTFEEGLYEATNEFLYTDQDNITWIGSLDGVFQFDGNNTTNLKPIPQGKAFTAGMDVQSPFFSDEQGNIWFTTFGAINCYRKAEGDFIQVKAAGAKGGQDVEPYVFHLEQERYLWVRSNDMLYRVDTRQPNQDTREPLLRRFDAVRAAAEEDEYGNVVRVYGGYWAQSNLGFDMTEFSVNPPGSTFRKRYYAKASPPFDSSLSVSQVIPNVKDEIAVIGRHGLLLFNASSEKSDYYPYPTWVKRRAKAIRLGNQLIFTTGTSQILYFCLNEREFKDKTLVAFNLDNQEEIGGINNIFLGRDSILWVSARGKGVYYSNLRNRHSFNLFHKENIEEQQVANVHQLMDGTVITVNDRGLVTEFLPTAEAFIRNRETSKKFPPRSQLIELPNGKLWAKSNQGLGRWEEARNDFHWMPETKGLSNIHAITTWRDSFLVLGCSDTLQLVNTRTGEVNLIPELVSIHSLFVDRQQRLWASNFSGDLFVGMLDVDSLSFTYLHRYESLGIVNQIVEDSKRNNLLIASSTGLITIADTLSSPTYLTEQDGLPNQYIKSLQVDRYGRIWLGTNKGIIRYSPDNAHNKFRLLNKRDGLSSNEYTAGAALTLQSGDLLFGSTKGVDIIPSNLGIIGKPPTLSIKHIKIHDREWYPNSARNRSGEIAVSHRENTFTFDLTAAEYTDPIRNKIKAYLYHSNGVDSSMVGQKGQVTYSNLQPDDYVFKFTACNAEGLWQLQKLEFPFTIKPPWYKRPEWISLFAILALAIAVAVPSFIYSYRLRTKQLELEKQQRLSEQQHQKLEIQSLQAEKKEALERERDQINAEFHSILNDGLVTIKNTCSTIKNAPKSDVVAKAIGVIQNKTLDLFEKKRHLIWAINPENSRLDDLFTHIRFYSANLLVNNGKAYQLDFPEGELLSHAVSSKAKYNLFMTIKELLHNTLKSSECTMVQIKVSLDEGRLLIIVSDDGVGFDFAQVILNKQKSYGIHKCLGWIKTLGGTIIWHRVSGETQAEILVALEKLT